MSASDNPSDQDLMARFAERRSAADFEAIVRRWDRPLFSFLVKACGDSESAEDLRQEVFLRVFQYGSSYRPEQNFAPWLFRIAINSLKSWRKKPRTGEIIQNGHDATGIVSLNPPSPIDPRQAAVRSEVRVLVRRLLNQLEPEERGLLLLKFEAGLSYREIGEAMETAETTIKSRVYKILRHMRVELERLGAESLEVP